MTHFYCHAGSHYDECFYTECQYAEGRFAKCHYYKCHYDECRCADLLEVGGRGKSGRNFTPVPLMHYRWDDNVLAPEWGGGGKLLLKELSRIKGLEPKKYL